MPLRPQTLYPAHANQHPAVTGGNVAILSAENPRFPSEMQGEPALKAELDRLGLDYEVTKGRYGAPERSFIVNNPDLPVVLNLARRLGQESVAYSENGRHQLHFVNGPQAGMATNPSEKHQWYDQEPQDNYTAVPSPNGEPLGYFTWNIDFDSPMVPSSPTPMTQEQVAPMAKGEDSLVASIRKTLEALGELRTRELAKAEPPVTNSDAYFHPSEKGAPSKPRPAGPPAQNTYRKVPKDYRKAELGATPHVPASPATPTPTGSQVNIETNPFKKPDWKPLGTAMKSEYDAGSAVSMVQGDMTHVRSRHGMKKSVESQDYEHIRRVREAEDKELANIPLRDPNKGPWPKDNGRPVPSIAEERQKMAKSESTKVDPLDGDIAKQKHTCRLCKREMSPVEAALRKNEGSHLRCAQMEKAEMKYDKNEPQHNQADVAWKPSISEPTKAPGSGGKVTRNPVGTSSNDGAASTTFPMKKAEVPAARPRDIVSVLRSKTLAKGSLEAKLGTGKTDHLAAGAPTGTNMPNPTPVAKAEGMPVPAAPKPPQAPGAKPSQAGGLVKAQCECGKPDCMWCKGKKSVKKAEGSADSNLRKPAESSAQESFMQGIRHGWKPTRGKYKGKDLPSKADAEKVLGMHKSEHASLHKAIRETIDLHKADPGSLKAGMRQASFAAKPTTTGLPAAGKVQPKSPAEYDAAAFRPASPGAAGAPSGLELDTKRKVFEQGFKPAGPAVGKGGPGMAQTGAGGKPGMTTLKGGLPIAKLTGIRGAPLSKPKV